LYHFPELYDGHDFGEPVDHGDVELCQELYASPKHKCCENIIKFAHCSKPAIRIPSNAEDGFRLYEELISLYEHEVKK
jgi:hypothetical protein